MTLRLLVVLGVLVAVGGLVLLRRRPVDARALPPLPDDLAGTKPTWVVFTTEWCATCEPVKERIARLDPDAELVEIDVAVRPDLARRYRVRSAPTVLFAPGGRDVEARYVGNIP